MVQANNDPLGGYNPVYDKGKLLGFKKGETFIPKEAAVTKEGLYKPQEVKETKTQTTKQGSSVTYYKTPSGESLQNITTGESTQYRVIGDSKTKALYKGTIQKDIKSQLEPNKLKEVMTPQSNKLTSQLSKQQVVSKLNLPYETRGTLQDTGKQVNIPILSPGTIYQYQTDTLESKGRTIPYYKTYTIGEDYSSRQPTKQEFINLQDFVSAEKFKETGLSEPQSNIKRISGEAIGKVKILGSEELYSPKQIKESSSKFGKVGEISGGFVAGLLPETKMDLIKTGAILGVSAGAGFGIKGITSGLSYVSPLIGTGFKASTYGAGAYFTGVYGLGVASQFEMKEDVFGKSQVIGKATREFGTGLIGFKLGSKGYDITEGLYRTRGRSFLELPQGEYPQAQTSKQLKLFQKNLYPELGKEPGAFHTTSQTFWKGGTITPKPGTSELPGLYGSTKVSTPFAKVSGSKFKLLPSVSDIFSTPSKPGIAYLQPKGFRTVKSIKVSPYQIEGQKFEYKFLKQPKQGYADITGIKSEIEAVFRPGAGSYGFESGKYYTKISGVRVPLDVFKYSPEPSIKTGKVFSSKNYYTISSQPLFTPQSSLISYSYKPSYSFGYSSIKGSSSISKSLSIKSSISKSSGVSKSSGLSISKSSLPSSKSFGSSVKISSYKSPSSASFSGVYSGVPGITSKKKPKTPPTTFNFPELDFSMKGKKIKRPKIKPSLKPSFTASAFDIRGSMPKLGKLGITPIQLRKLPI